MSGYRGLAHGYRYAFRRFEAEMPKSVGVTMSICRGLAHGYRQRLTKGAFVSESNVGASKSSEKRSETRQPPERPS